MTRSLFASAGVVLALYACANPVADSEAALGKGDNFTAYRIARKALSDASLAEDRRKRLGSVLRTAATHILDAPDQGAPADARELLDGMPAGTEERQRAAQRYLRVVALTGEESAFTTALRAVEPEMGNESEVRSNLRAIVVATRGKRISVMVASLVAGRWPDDADRWLDVASSNAAVGSWSEAHAALLQAEQKLTSSCLGLPARRAAYDKVKRESAYGDLELQRCRSFHKLGASWSAYARQQTSSPPLSGSDLLSTKAARVPCPTSAPAATEWTAEMFPLLIAPAPSSWWVDGKLASLRVQPVSPGVHDVTWQDGAVCQRLQVDVRGPTAILGSALSGP